MQKMEEESVEFHKGDVLEMLNEYYRYAEQGIAIGDFKSLCWVPMQNDINYTMRIPYWWDDPQGLGTADIVKHYFGALTNLVVTPRKHLQVRTLWIRILFG